MADSDNNLIVEAVGLSKIFRDFWGRPKAAAVNNINFEIKPGQVIGFLGPNGSGKSTTIKMMLGLLYPTSGSLKIFNRAPNHVQTKVRIGYLPEETYLYKYLTAIETLDFFGALFNLPENERKSRAKQLLDMVGMSHAAHRPVGEFSKGMARRIGLAQALINDPDLIILDEPTSGLDPIGCRQVKEIIRTLAERKKTVILCSHLLADVEDVCDQVMIMYGGRIRARGTMEELLTVEDKTRIVAPHLEPETIERVMTILNEASESGSVAVDRPRMNLEDYFMNVVRQARKESQDTSGASNEGAIATYLSGDEKKGGEDLLKSLATQGKPEEEPADEEPAAPAVDTSKLANLASTQEKVKPEPSPDQPAPKKELTDDEKAAANKKIEDLLNKK